MAFLGINCRQRITHANGAPADGSGQTYFDVDGFVNYPITRGGLTFGPLNGAGWQGRDRNSTGSDDPRLCGIAYPDTTTQDFRIDLPGGAGNYRIRLALGDKDNAMTSGSCEIRDGASTSLATVSGTTAGANNFLDATSTNRTASAWISSNATVTLTFATGYAILRLNTAARIAHVALEQVGTDATASGATVSAAASLIAGSASVAASAAGVTLTAAASLIAGSATTGTNATANGVTLAAAVSLVAGAATGNNNATLNFQAAGMEFGARTGSAISTFALQNGVSYRHTVHADGLVLGAALITSSAITLDSAGKLPNLTGQPLLFIGQTYRVHAIRQTDGEAATFRMVAQA